ncbi:non-canonical purine NTP pyrophosphatase [Rhizobium leguminosarum]|uniref:non-canonical purine NTP pyrophosphatase n=1 Tax=Rhizobium leguminosarum TaxID=384 RepID=UPI003F9C6466
MLTITFFTSNSTKLAHARYLADGLPIKINSFRERTYHADYDEPRLQSRAELLHESYKSAVVQSKKARILSSRHFFILEDTSVRIDALSGDGRDVPGLDVKYWMKDATFESLNQSIALGGGNRAATVRSDVVLHIPDTYRRKWGIENEYLVFTGEQAGEIVDVEQDFSTNVVYPWLDNRTFNKWFRPLGAQAPLGMLAISEATKYDFRRKSFEKLFEFLQGKQRLTTPAVQDSLSLRDQMNFIICGYPCAGKTTSSQHLAKSFGYLHVEASDFMHLNFYLRHGVVPPEELSIGDFAEKALQEKPEIAAEVIGDYIASDPYAPAVVSGFRSLEEVRWLTHRMSQLGKQFKLVFVESGEEERFARMRTRNRLGDVDEIGKFRLRDRQQQRMGISDIVGDTETAVIPNISTIEAFKAEIDVMVGRPPAQEPKISQLLGRISQIPRVKLEDAILLALLTEWSDEGNRQFFTTSEIAKLANTVLGAKSKKHKDNVSRYFNQNFYPFYEIDVVGPKAVRKYRLSNTGYGKALRTLRSIVENAPGGTL